MKKILTLTALFLLTLSGLFAQQTVQIGTGTASGSHLINQTWHRTFTQTIYTADLLPAAMNITQIAYEYVGTDTRPKQIKIWMSTTTENDINGRFALLPQQINKVLVFEGELQRTPPGDGQESVWLPIVLQTPYLYTGDNLLITTSFMNGNTGQNTGFRVSPSSTGKFVTSHYWNSGGSGFMELDEAVLAFDSPRGTFNSFTNIRFTYTTPTGSVFSIKPQALDYPEMMINTTADQNVTISNSGTGTVTVSGVNFSDTRFFSTDAQFPITLGAGASQNITFSFKPIVHGTFSSVAQFTVSGADHHGTNTVALSGVARDFVHLDTRCLEQIPPLGVTSSGPFGEFLYVANQYIIDKNEIGTDIEGRIRRIGWNSDRPCTGDNKVAIYLQNTTADGFPWPGSTGLSQFTNAADMTKVFEGRIQSEAEGWVYADIEPFLYDGTSNLRVFTVQLESSGANIGRFYVKQKEVAGRRQVTHYASHTVSMDAYNPPTVGTQLPTRVSQNNFVPDICFVFEEIPNEANIFTSPKILEYEEMELTVVKTFPVTVRNFGKADLVITNIAFTSADFFVTDVTFPITIPYLQERTINFAASPLQLGFKAGLATFEFATPTLGNPYIDLSVSGRRFNALHESFERTFFPPMGWKVIDGDNDGATYERYFLGDPRRNFPTSTMPVDGISMASGPSAFNSTDHTETRNEWLIPPKLRYAEGDKFGFHVASGTGAATLFPESRLYVKISMTGNNVADFTRTIDYITFTHARYTHYEYDLGEMGLKDGDEFYIALHDVGAPRTHLNMIDMVTGPAMVMPNHDLAIQDFSAATGDFHVGDVVTYTALIGNAGLTTAESSDFTVELVARDHLFNTTVLTSIQGQTLKRGEYYKVSIDHTFSVHGNYNVFMRVVYAQDENTANNSTNTILREIFPTNLKYLRSGRLDSNTVVSPIPMNLVMAGIVGSVAQSYYPQAHFGGSTGIIERVRYYINNPVARPNRNVRIWMANTTLDSLSAGQLLNSNEMELVFDGRASFQRTMTQTYEPVEINLTTPFTYTGDNLIVMFEHTGGSASGGTDNIMFYTNRVSGRSYYRSIWGGNIDEWDVNEVIQQHWPNTPIMSFLVEQVDGIGAMTGQVVDVSTAAVAGARVAVTSATYPRMNAVTHTDDDGNFHFPKIFAANDLKIAVSKFGFLDAAVQGIEVLIDQTTTVPAIQLPSHPKVAVTGKVLTSDRQEPLPGATVKLFGMDDYTTTTGADGIFTFNDVWTNSTYRVEIEHDDYQKLITTAQVVEAAVNMGDITVLQIAYPAKAVTTTVLANQSAEIKWVAPLDEHPTVFRRDDGNIGLAPTLYTNPFGGIIGTAFHDNGIIEKVTWFQPRYSDAVTSDTMNIYIFGLSPDGTPNHQNILGRYLNIGTSPMVWNTFVLPAPVTAENGFFVGIGGVNHGLYGIVMDNGNDPEWPWRARTMWTMYNFEPGADGPLNIVTIEDQTSPQIRRNNLIRAEGIWTGYFVPRSSAPALATTDEEELFGTDYKSAPAAGAEHALPTLTLSTPDSPQGFFTEIPQESSRIPTTFIQAESLPTLEWNSKGVLQYAPTGAPSLSSVTPLPPVGYNIYRANLFGSGSGTYTRINTAGPITATTFVDPDFESLGRGSFRYAVRALYVGGVESARSLSNIIDRDVHISGQLNVTHNATGHPLSLINGASLLLVDNATRTQYTGTLDNTGIISLAGVLRGVYTITITAEGFETYRNNALDFTTSQTVYNVDVELKEIITKPSLLNIKPEQPNTAFGSVADFSWNPPPFFDDAEGHPNFTIANIENWTMHDVAGGNTASLIGYNWLNMGVPQAFIVYNPSATTPQSHNVGQGILLSPYQGQKFFLSWRKYGSSVITDNWLISKELDYEAPFEFSFYAHSVRGSEDYRISYSSGSDQWRNFITLGGNRSVTSADWQRVSVIMPAEAKRVAIQHFRSDLGLKLDNITIGTPIKVSQTFKHYEVYLDDRFVGQTTDVDFQFTELRNGIRTAGVVAVYSSGKSEMSTIEFEVTNGIDNKFYVDVLEMENGTIVVKNPSGTEIPEGTLIDGGTTITITAVPEYGYRPLLVTVDGNPFVSGSSIAITKDLLVTATFEIRTYEITFNPNGGTGTMSPQGFTYGIPQNLTPNAFTPPTDMYFIGWAYTATGDIVYSNQAEYFATENKTLFAIWDDNPVVVCTITLSANPTIGGTVSGGGNHNQGLQATVRATANSGYRFVNWTEGETTVSTEANYSFTVTDHRTLVANFVQLFRVNITAPTNGTISVKAGGVDVNHGDEFDHGTELTLLATPAENYEFVRWAHDNHNQPMHSHTLTNHVTISAVFRLKSSIQTTEKEILTIYPNPVKDELNIQTEQVIKNIVVFDLSGKIMMNLQGNHRTINMQTIPIGNYIIRIHTENAIIPVRIVKQ